VDVDVAVTVDPVRAKGTRLPALCSVPPSARVLLVRSHLLVAYCSYSMAWMRRREARNPAEKKLLALNAFFDNPPAFCLAAEGLLCV
jgi:hypothetical protein